MVRWTGRATSDVAALETLWREFLGVLAGPPCGAASNVFVLDLDTDRATGEAVGGASLRALGFGHLATDASQPRVRAPSGGLHLLFRHPGEGFGNTAGKLGPKRDTRGDGGDVSAPGTVAPAGTSRPEAPRDWHALPPLPEGLWTVLASHQKPEEPPFRAAADAHPPDGAKRRWRANWRGSGWPRWGNGSQP